MKSFFAVSILVYFYAYYGSASMFLQPISKISVNRKIIPITPILPNKYFTDFVLWYTNQDVQPPWFQLPPKFIPYVVGRGKTWYSWDQGKCVELYLDFCVPIFYPNSFFPCVMFNFNSTAYLLSNLKYRYGGCCIYKKPWSPPHRDFMGNFAKYYVGNNMAYNISTDWWKIPNFENGNQKVFGGYGWSSQLYDGTFRKPLVFWYEGDVGWAQQMFYNFTTTGPEIEWIDKHFKFPVECHNALPCKYKP